MTKWTNFPRFFGLKRHATMDYHSLTKDSMGSDPLAWPRSSATPLFQSTLPHGERPVYRKDITEEIEISIHAPAWGATFTKRAYVKVWQFQSTLPHGERPSTPQNHPTQQTFQSTLPHGERQGRNGLGHDRRRISIHAPAWGATKESIRRVPVVCYFNPRSRMGSDQRINKTCTCCLLFQSTLPHGERPRS